MSTKTPAQIAQKWARDLAASTETIRTGVEAVTESPTSKAAARADAYLRGVQQAVADGKWQNGLNRVSLQQWKDDMLTKGLPRIASGASQAEPKFQAFMSEFMPHIEQGLRQLQGMPRGDLNQNIQRMVAMVQHNARFRRRS